jgi:hypothetical protein
MPAPREVVIVVWEIQQSVARVQFVWLRVRRLVCVELTHPLKETKSHRDGAMTLTFGPCFGVLLKTLSDVGLGNPEARLLGEAPRRLAILCVIRTQGNCSAHGLASWTWAAEYRRTL